MSASPTQPEMLESATASPLNNKYYGEENLFRLAAILASRIIKNHAFQDGNKRAALYSADMFLKINGYQLQKKPMAPDDEELNQALTDAHVAVATDVWTEEELGDYYESIAQPLEHRGKTVKKFRDEAEKA